MNVGELLDHLRARLLTIGAPQLPNKILIGHINNAYREFVAGMEGVPDEVEVELAEGVSEAELDRNVLKIKSAANAAGRTIRVVNRGDTEYADSASYMDKPGEVRVLLIGHKQNTFKVGGVPMADTTIRLDVDRLPLVALEQITDEPTDVRDTFHLEMLEGAVYRIARMSNAAEVKMAADDAYVLFTAAFTKARSAKSRAASKTVRTVNYGGL